MTIRVTFWTLKISVVATGTLNHHQTKSVQFYGKTKSKSVVITALDVLNSVFLPVIRVTRVARTAAVMIMSVVSDNVHVTRTVHKVVHVYQRLVTFTPISVQQSILHRDHARISGGTRFKSVTNIVTIKITSVLTTVIGMIRTVLNGVMSKPFIVQRIVPVMRIVPTDVHAVGKMLTAPSSVLMAKLKRSLDLIGVKKSFHQASHSPIHTAKFFGVRSWKTV